MTIERVSLGTYVKVVGGFAFKSEDFSDEGIPVIRISDLQNGALSLNNVARIPKARVGKGESYRVDPGDILVAMSGATTGKIGLAPSEFDGLLLQNQRVGNFKITDNSKIDKRYLRHFVSSPSYQSQIWKTMAGVAQPNVSSKQLESFEFPLPPLTEQRRIAEVLDRAEALRAKRRTAVAQLDSLAQSLFLDLFGDSLSNPMRWPLKRLHAVLDLITYGLTVRPEYVPMGIPLISAKEIRAGTVAAETAAKISQEDFDSLSDKAKPVEGDILFSKTGSIGHSAIVMSKSPIAVAQNVARLAFKSELVDKTYALYYLRTESIQSLAQRSARGNAVKDLQLGVMQQFPFPLAPLELQREFACRVSAVEKLKTAQRASLAEMDALFASLQHRAFRGEL